jgi:hypothetical protein
MQNSKILQILRLFNTAERLSLRRYAEGIAATQRTLAPNLLAIILPYLHKNIDATAKVWQKTALFAKLFDKNTAYDDNLMRRYMYELTELVEDFIAKQELEQQTALKTRLLVDFYAKRGQTDLAQSHFAALRTQRTAQTLRDIHFFYDELIVNEIDLNLQELQQRNEYDLQVMNDTLNTVLIAGKLRHHCKTFLSGKVYNNEFSSDLLRDILGFVENNAAIYAIPVIGIYYHIYKMLNEESLDDFHKFRAILVASQTLFAQKEISDFYTFAENLHVFLVSKNKITYTQMRLLYEEGFEKGFIYGSDGNISVFRLQNAITAALRSDAIDWALLFLEQNKAYLPEAIRNDVYHSNLANIYFYKCDFAKVKQMLAETQYKDIIYQIAARRLQIKLYKAENKQRALNTALNSFERYLMTTKKKIGSDSRTMNLAFVRALRRINDLSFIDSRSRSAPLEKLRTDIQSEKLIAERPWLLTLL